MPATGSTTPTRKRGIPYTVLTGEGDTREQWVPGSVSTSYLCSTAWATSGEFLADMLGWSEVVGASVRRVLPEKNPFGRGQYALSADLVRQFGNPHDPDPWASPDDSPAGDNAFPEYTTSVYRVTFGRPLYDVREDAEVSNEKDRFVVRRGKGSAQNERIPGAAYRFATDNVTPGPPMGETGVRTGRLLAKVYKWVEVPADPDPVLVQYGNKVNSVTFDGRFPAGTVLFESWDSEPRASAIGQLVWDVTLNFLVRADGRTWNVFWRRDGTYCLVTDTGLLSGSPPFQSADLNGLFRVG